MDSFLLSTIKIVPHRLKRIKEDYEDEVRSWPIKLITGNARKALWNVCTALEVNKHGVAGQACRVLEMYLATHMQTATLNHVLDQEYKKKLASNLPLLMAASVQLAAKMCSTSFLINPKVMCSYFTSNGLVFSIKDIIRSEYTVFSMLNHHIPLWTSVEVAQLLSLEIGFPDKMMAGIEMVMDISEFHRPTINETVLKTANETPSDSDFNTSTVRTLHLVAGAVLAGARYLDFSGPDIPERLAALTHAPPNLVKCLADSIIKYLIVDTDKNENTAKRMKMNCLENIS